MRGPSCCTSRHPPSPDLLNSRPVASQPEIGSTIPKVSIPWASWGTSSDLSKLEMSAELRAIFDNNASNNPEPNSPAQSKRSRPLHQVRSRLRKHFSRDSGLAVQESHPLIEDNVDSTSPPDERRAPLNVKKDRLSSMGLYDEDAKSLSLSSIQIRVAERHSMISAGKASVVSTPRIEGKAEIDPLLKDGSLQSVDPNARILRMSRRRSETLSSDYKKPPSGIFPVLNRRHSSASLICSNTFKETQPEWIQNLQDRLPPMPAAPMILPQRLPSIVSSTRRTSWRLSFSSDRRASQLRALSQQPERQGEEPAQGPLSGLNAVRWFRAQGLRMSSQAMGDSSSGTDLETFASHKKICSGSEDFGGVDGNHESYPFGLTLTEMRIHDRLVSSLFSSRSSPQLSSWSSRDPSGNNSTTSSFTRLVNRSRNRYFHNLSKSDTAIATKFPPISYRFPQDGAASSTKSRSPQPTSKTSFPNLQDILAVRSNEMSIVKDTENDKASNSKRHESTPTVGTSTDSREPAQTMTDQIGYPLTKHSTPEPRSRRLTVDSSIPASETASFRQRELELNVVQARFPPGLFKKLGSNGPVQSKFREEFDESLPPPPNTKPSSSSFFSVLQLSKKSKSPSMNHDGSVSLKSPGIPAGAASAQHLALPGTDLTSATARSKSTSALLPQEQIRGSQDIPVVEPESQSGGESAANMWQRAIRRSMDDRSTETGRSKGSLSRFSRKKSSEDSGLYKVSYAAWKRKGKYKRSSEYNEQDQMLTSNDDEEALQVLRPQYATGSKPTTPQIQIWEDQTHYFHLPDSSSADIGDELTRTYARTQSPSSSPRRPAIPPRSWARYPSHTRQERNGSAGPSDNVYVKDFAIRHPRMNNNDINTSSGDLSTATEWLTTDRKHFLPHRTGISLSTHPNNPQDTPSSSPHTTRHILPQKLIQYLRASLDRVRTRNSTIMNDNIHGRRSTTSLAGELEYPELEVLAFDRERPGALEQLELEVAAAMRMEERKRRWAVLGVDDREMESGEEGGSHDERERGSDRVREDLGREMDGEWEYYDDRHVDDEGDGDGDSAVEVRDPRTYISSSKSFRSLADNTSDVPTHTFETRHSDSKAIPTTISPQSATGIESTSHSSAYPFISDSYSPPASKYGTQNGPERTYDMAIAGASTSVTSIHRPSLGTTVLKRRNASVSTSGTGLDVKLDGFAGWC